MVDKLSVDDFVETFGQYTVLELAEINEKLKETYNIEAAAAAVAVVAPGAGEAAEEKTEFDVILTGFGDKKLNVIKKVRTLTDLGLKEAKELVDNVPKTLMEAVPKDKAEEVKTALEGEGATVEIK